MCDEWQGIVTVTMRLATPFALIATNSEPLKSGDAILERLLNLGRKARLKSAGNKIRSFLIHYPMVDPVIPPLVRYAHFVIAGHVLATVARLDKDISL